MQNKISQGAFGVCSRTNNKNVQKQWHYTFSVFVRISKNFFGVKLSITMKLQGTWSCTGHGSEYICNLIRNKIPVRQICLTELQLVHQLEKEMKVREVCMHEVSTFPTLDQTQGPTHSKWTLNHCAVAMVLMSIKLSATGMTQTGLTSMDNKEPSLIVVKLRTRGKARRATQLSKEDH